VVVAAADLLCCEVATLAEQVGACLVLAERHVRDEACATTQTHTEAEQAANLKMLLTVGSGPLRVNTVTNSRCLQGYAVANTGCL
jgi:hypothetical protein